MNAKVEPAELDETVAAEVVAEGGGREVTLEDGRKVTISKCKVRHIAPVVRLLKEVMAQMGVETVGDADTALDMDKIPDLMDLIIGMSGRVFEVVSMMSSLDNEELADLELEDALIVATAVWGLNKDFFLKKVLPLVQGRVGN